jgi:hypothetical protein
MTASQLRKTTYFLWKTLPEPSLLGPLPNGAYASVEPGWNGRRAGTIQVKSDKIIRIPRSDPTKGQQRVVWAQCQQCGHGPIWRHWEQISGGRSAGCQSCAEREPEEYRWLRKRLQAAKDRCNRPGKRLDTWSRYGGRGITFDFPSVRAAVIWCFRNLEMPAVLDPLTEIDRIDNDLGYAPGNLKFSTKEENLINRDITVWVDFSGIKVPMVHALHVFRARNPKVNYSDNTLHRLLRILTEDQVIMRWKTKSSAKPVGVYGTYLTPDPAIVSLYPGV